MTVTELVDALTGKAIPVRDGRIEFTVPALFGSVLLGATAQAEAAAPPRR